MNTMELVRMVERAKPRSTSRRSTAPLFHSELFGPVRQAILRARQSLLSEQDGDGAWIGVQLGDVSLASQLVLTFAYFGKEHSEQAQKAAESIFAQQLPGGGWSLSPNGQPDVSTSVQAYFALKLTGVDPNDERMSGARGVIRRLGGADAADGSARFFLALLGQVDYDCCPVILPEAPMLSGGTRRLNVPLSIVWSHRPVQDVGIECGVRELFLRKPELWPALVAVKNGRLSKLAGTPRLLLGSLLRRCEHRGWTPLRGGGLERMEARLLEQIQPGQIERLDFHELLWHAIAVRTLGFADDSAEARGCERRMQELVCEDEDGIIAGPRLRTSPVGDTAMVIRSLRASGLPADHLAMERAIAWLSRETSADLSLDSTELCEVGAMIDEWAREADDVGESLPPEIEVCRARWPDCDKFTKRESLLGQFDRLATTVCDRLRARLQHAPDQAVRLLEALPGCNGQAAAESDRATEELCSAQSADGGWMGQQNAGRVCATAAAVRSMVSAGVSKEDPAILAAINWLIVHQQPGGGWSEVATDESELQGAQWLVAPGPQSSEGDRPASLYTAVALHALVLAGKANHPAARRGVQFLIESQEADGRWHEPRCVIREAATGRWCGNDLRSVAWPLLALSRWIVAASNDPQDARESFGLRLVNGSAGN